MLSPMSLLYVKMFLFFVPFDVWDRLWVAIRSVSEVQSNFNGSNTFGIMKISSRQGSSSQ